MIDKTEEIEYYIKFAKLAQEQDNNDMEQRILMTLKNELMGKALDKINDAKVVNDLAKVEFAIFQNAFQSGFF